MTDIWPQYLIFKYGVLFSQGNSNEIQTTLQNLPVQWDIISHDTSKKTSSFLGQLEKRLDFTEPDGEAYSESSEMTSPYGQAGLGKNRKWAHLCITEEERCWVWRQRQPNFLCAKPDEVCFFLLHPHAAHYLMLNCQLNFYAPTVEKATNLQLHLLFIWPSLWDA